MKSYVFIILLLLGLTEKLISQNLVLNPSFEELANPESKGYINFEDINENLMYWTAPTRATTDYYNNNPSIRPDKNWLDSDIIKSQAEQPHSGEKMAAIHTFGYASSDYCDKTTEGEIREYLQGTLSEPTVPGEAYFIRFWVRRAQHGCTTNNLGIVFLTEAIHNDDCYRLDFVPHFNEEDVIDHPPNIWHPITAKVILRDTFRHFIIGNFFSNRQTITTSSLGLGDHSYYYIDDVFISKVLTKEEIAALKARKRKQASSGIAASLAKAELNSNIQLDEVYFKTDSWDLDPRSFKQLNELANWLKISTTARILIKGHTDKRGKESYNQKLSARRARSVAEYLQSQGAAELQISTRGYGSSVPKVQAGDASALQANRRVEFEILSK